MSIVPIVTDKLDVMSLMASFDTVDANCISVRCIASTTAEGQNADLRMI